MSSFRGVLADVGTGVVASDGAGPQFQKPSCRTDPTHSSCKDDDRPTYRISATGAISFTEKVTRAVKRPEHLVVDNVGIDLSFFSVKMGCNPALGVPEGMMFSLDARDDHDDHLHLKLIFKHNGANHLIDLLPPKSPNTPWPPVGDVTLTETNGQWAVTSGGKNRRDACTGEGTGITYTIRIVPVL